jgi:hypothetical protein
MVTHTAGGSHLHLGGMALLVGVLATVVTAYTIIARSRKEAAARATAVSDDGWDEDLGM